MRQIAHPVTSPNEVPPLHRVVIAAVFFVVGMLIAIPALMKSYQPAAGSVHMGQSPSLRPAPTPGGSISEPSPVATVTVTPTTAAVSIVMPTSIGIKVDDGGDKKSAIWTALGSFLAGAGALGMALATYASRQKAQPEEQHGRPRMTSRSPSSDLGPLRTRNRNRRTSRGRIS